MTSIAPGKRRKSWQANQAEASAAPLLPAWAKALVLILLACLVVYAGALDSPFEFDSRNNILDRGFDKMPLGEVLTPKSRYLVDFTFWLNHRWGGVDPWGYNALNVVIHAACAAALFAVVRETLARLLDPQAALRVATATALVWGVHPLATQGVTYTVQRAEQMMALGALLVLWTLNRSDRARGWKSVAWLLASVAAFYMGLYSKSVMFAALPTAVAFDRIYLADTWGSLVRRRGWAYLAMLVCFLGSLSWVSQEVSGGAGGGVGFSQNSISPAWYAVSQAGVILHYLRLVVLPWPQCVDYGWRPAADLAEAAGPLLAMGLLGLATVALLVTRPRIGFLPLAFFFMLAPTSSVVPIVDLAFEHRMYLPLAAVVCLGVGVCHLLLADRPKTARLLLACVVVALGLRTVARNEDYDTRERFWASVVEVCPENPRGWHNLARNRQQEGRLPEAIDAARRWIETASSLGQSTAEATLVLGELQAVSGDPGAPATLDRAIELYAAEPQRAQGTCAARIACGSYFQIKNDWAKAAEQYRLATEAEPASAPALAMLGSALVQTGKTAEAAAAWERAVALVPDWPDVHRDLARAYAALGDQPKAAQHARLSN